MATTTEVISSVNDLLASHSALILKVRNSQQSHRRQLLSLQFPPAEILDLPLIPSSPPSPVDADSPPSSPTLNSRAVFRADLPPAKRARAARYKNYVPEEETIRNDYSQRYVDGGEWPQNWVLGADPEHRFEEYPKQQRLLGLKRASVNSHSVAPSYLPFSALQSLHPAKFDVILLDPPFSSSFTWEHLQELPIPALAADPSFVFLWVGSGAGEGLESGREVLAKWGYRRCEGRSRVKTNNYHEPRPWSDPFPNPTQTDPPTSSLLTRTKQHCLIGIRGTVRRSTDSWFVHCNVDTDVIFWEGDPTDPTRKPPEMYTLIENFCLGTRRLEVFGRASSSLRRGWVTALAPGQEDRLPQDGLPTLANGGKTVVPMTPEIDALRPKSPFRPGAQNANSNSGGAMGTGGGGARFGGGNRGGNFGGPQNQGQVQGVGQGQMMGQPMMGMGMNPMGVGDGDEWWSRVWMHDAVARDDGRHGRANGRWWDGPRAMMGQMGMGYGFNGAMAGRWAGGWGDQSQYAMGDQGQYMEGQYMDGCLDDGMGGAMNMAGMNAGTGMNGGMGMEWASSGAMAIRDIK
ncbi:MT-A70-domain-containing protein [Mycena olivaceomarginata]|nr:MT-A70-domain-containing protein [Mycena olivaceomarginata]